MESFCPFRVLLYDACGGGIAGKGINTHQFARGTGNVLAVSETADIYFINEFPGQNINTIGNNDRSMGCIPDLLVFFKPSIDIDPFF